MTLLYKIIKFYSSKLCLRILLIILIVYVDTLTIQSGVIEKLQFFSSFIIQISSSVIEQEIPDHVNLSFLKNQS